VSWTSYNHPSAINSAGESVQFAYKQDHTRWSAIYSGSAGLETTYFIGDLLEKVITAGSNDYRHYIFAGGTKVAIYSRISGGTNALHYVREDHLGGVSGILNSDGTSDVKESFTAFGARRSSCTWSGPPTSGGLQAINAVTPHGFTWQTALGSMGLNDMNGRIQDAVTGRFLSPDPTIPNPGFTQSFNRYSYVNNNPLTYADPSGFDPDDADNVSVCANGGAECGTDPAPPNIIDPSKLATITVPSCDQECQQDISNNNAQLAQQIALWQQQQQAAAQQAQTANEQSQAGAATAAQAAQDAQAQQPQENRNRMAKNLRTTLTRPVWAIRRIEPSTRK
jgi:RHS repeat-associated protein